MKKYAPLILSGIALLAISAVWVVPKINSNPTDTYVRVIEKPDARSHWEDVKKNTEAVQIEKKSTKKLKNPDRFATKKVKMKEFKFDPDMYGRGMHYEPSYMEINAPIEVSADSVSSDTTAAVPVPVQETISD